MRTHRSKGLLWLLAIHCSLRLWWLTLMKKASSPSHALSHNCSVLDWLLWNCTLYDSRKVNIGTGGCSIAVLQFYHKSYVHHRPAQCKWSTLSNTSHSTAALLYTASPNTTDIASRNTWATHAAQTVIHLQLRIDVLPLLLFLLAEGEFHITHILLMHRWWNRKKWKKHRHSWTYPHSQGC